MPKLPNQAIQTLILSSLFSLGLYAASTLAEETTPPPAMDNNAPVITVNGAPISRNMFTIFYQRSIPRKAQTGKLSDQMRAALLDQLVNFLLLGQEAEKLGLDKKPAVEAGLQLIRAEYLANIMLGSQASKNPITEDQLKEMYQKETAAPAPKEFKARHILLKDEDSAKDIIRKLDEGADFEKLAKEHSTGPSAVNGGDLGWFGMGSMVAEFEQAIVALESGKWSTTPVKTQFGWHVILVEETREKARPTFEKMKNRLVEMEQKSRLSAYVRELRSKADIKVIEKSAIPAQKTFPDKTTGQPLPVK